VLAPGTLLVFNSYVGRCWSIFPNNRSALLKLLVLDPLRITIERQVQLDSVLEPCL
jgi:hypothetical protein